MTDAERIVNRLDKIIVMLAGIETYLGELFEDKLHSRQMVDADVHPIPQKFWP
jgi:hypothetical protein